MKTFLFRAVNGKPNFGSSHNRSRFDEHLKDNEGKEFTIKKKEEKRTLSQNNLYWVFLQKIEFETGNIATDLHEDFKRRFLPPRFIHIKGKGSVRELKIPGSTTELSKIQMGEYMDKISADSEIAIPSAEEAGYMTN